MELLEEEDRERLRAKFVLLDTAFAFLSRHRAVPSVRNLLSMANSLGGSKSGECALSADDVRIIARMAPQLLVLSERVAGASSYHLLMHAFASVTSRNIRCRRRVPPDRADAARARDRRVPARAAEQQARQREAQETLRRGACCSGSAAFHSSSSNSRYYNYCGNAIRAGRRACDDG